MSRALFKRDYWIKIKGLNKVFKDWVADRNDKIVHSENKRSKRVFQILLKVSLKWIHVFLLITEHNGINVWTWNTQAHNDTEELEVVWFWLVHVCAWVSFHVTRILCSRQRVNNINCIASFHTFPPES